MLMTLQISCNDYSKYYIINGKRPKVFKVKDGKKTLCLERSALSISLQEVYLLPNLVAVLALK